MLFFHQLVLILDISAAMDIRTMLEAHQALHAAIWGQELSTIFRPNVEVIRVPPTITITYDNSTMDAIPDDPIPKTCLVMDTTRDRFRPWGLEIVLIRTEYKEALKSALKWSEPYVAQKPDPELVAPEIVLMALDEPLILPVWSALEELYHLVETTEPERGGFLLTGHAGIGELWNHIPETVLN